jgi:hypothetical protein
MSSCWRGPKSILYVHWVYLRLGSAQYSNLLRNSEKLGGRVCVQTFFSAIHLIMPLLAITHKPDYMYLCQDLLKWHYCASPAQRKIYEEFIFKQLTANESLILHDTFVKLSAMDTCSKLGKVHWKGMEIAKAVVAANIPISDGGKLPLGVSTIKMPSQYCLRVARMLHSQRMSCANTTRSPRSIRK